MAADPRLDRIAAAFEHALSHADPAVQGHFTRISGRFIEEQLALYSGDPAELGAVLLNLYSDAVAMALRMRAEEMMVALTFVLGHAGTGLYLGRYPAPAAASPVPRKPSGLAGLLLTAGSDGPWLICRTCDGDDQVVGGFDDRTPLNDIVTIGLDHHDRLHAGQR